MLSNCGNYSDTCVKTGWGPRKRIRVTWNSVRRCPNEVKKTLESESTKSWKDRLHPRVRSMRTLISGRSGRCNRLEVTPESACRTRSQATPYQTSSPLGDSPAIKLASQELSIWNSLCNRPGTLFKEPFIFIYSLVLVPKLVKLVLVCTLDYSCVIHRH